MSLKTLERLLSLVEDAQAEMVWENESVVDCFTFSGEIPFMTEEVVAMSFTFDAAMRCSLSCNES